MILSCLLVVVAAILTRMPHQQCSINAEMGHAGCKACLELSTGSST